MDVGVSLLFHRIYTQIIIDYHENFIDMIENVANGDHLKGKVMKDARKVFPLSCWYSMIILNENINLQTKGASEDFHFLCA